MMKRPVGREEDAIKDGVVVVGGDSFRLLPDGPERLEMLVALIDGACESLRLIYYIYAPDHAGQRVRAALISACKRGVTVSLIVDGFGSSAKDDFFRPLVEAGAHICRYLPRFGRRYLLRNHQNLALADKARVIVGGFNIEDDYFGTAVTQGWRDLGLSVEGPAAARLASYFDELERWAAHPKRKFRDLRAILNRASETDGAVRWLMGGPTRRLSPWAIAIKREMERASRLHIIAGYFAPNPAILRRIERVAKRGGEATVVTAAKSDNNATVAAARHTYTRLLKRGVRVLEYAATKLHTKLFVIDDAVHIGSANLDIRSLYINLELMLRVEDVHFAAMARRYFAGELRDATEVTLETHAGHAWLARLRWGLAYFLVTAGDFNITRRLNFGLDGR